MRARYNGRSLSVFSNKLRATLIPRVQRQCQTRHRPHRPALGSRAMDDCICTCAIQEMKPRRGYNTGQAEGRSSDETLQSDALALLSDPPTQTLKTFAATRPFLRIWRVCCEKPYVTGEILSSPTVADLVSEMLEETSCGASTSPLCILRQNPASTCRSWPGRLHMMEL